MAERKAEATVPIHCISCDYEWVRAVSALFALYWTDGAWLSPASQEKGEIFLLWHERCSIDV